MGEIVFSKQADEMLAENLFSAFAALLKFYSFTNSVLRSQVHGPHGLAHFFATLTVKRLRPFLLLRLNTFLPEVSLMRFLNPCFLFRFTRLG